MKKIIILTFLSLSFGLNVYAQGEYKIKGMLADKSSDGMTVYLREIWPQGEEKRSILRDSTIVRHGGFTFKGIVAEPTLAQISVRTSPTLTNIFLILEPGNIDIKRNDPNDRIVTGSPLNDEYYREVVIPNILGDTMIRTKITRLMDKTWTQEDESSYMDYFMKNIYERALEGRKKTTAYIEKNIGFPRIISDMIISYEDTEKELFEKWMSQLPELYRDNIRSYLAYMDARKKEFMAKNPDMFDPLPEQTPDSVAIGKQIIDLPLRRADGSEAMLSELVKGNKITVLDFWASWCGPCIKEMPFMKELYEEFGDKGMGLIGISTDSREVDWQKALAKYDMPWTQVLGRNAGETYYVNSIPYTIIIDQNGAIAARRLRGEKLREKIQELLGE